MPRWRNSTLLSDRTAVGKSDEKSERQYRSPGVLRIWPRSHRSVNCAQQLVGSSSSAHNKRQTHRRICNRSPQRLFSSVSVWVGNRIEPPLRFPASGKQIASRSSRKVERGNVKISTQNHDLSRLWRVVDEKDERKGLGRLVPRPSIRDQEVLIQGRKRKDAASFEIKIEENAGGEVDD